MRNYYPLTAAQKMHHNWIMDYGTQQVSGVSVVASVQAELDFGLLKKCIQMETERSGCTRVRFTKPDKDGNVKQYIEKQDSRDIELRDLSGMESLANVSSISGAYTSGLPVTTAISRYRNPSSRTSFKISRPIWSVSDRGVPAA